MKRNSRAAFTLLEIMLVVVIIGMLVTIAAVKLIPRADEARVTATQLQIKNYGTALDLYQLHNGFYPTTEQSLQALITQPSSPPAPANWRGPYMDSLKLEDPWGSKFVYKCPGDHNSHGYDLYSPGPDGSKALKTTSKTGNRAARAGFSLIEIGIAVFILATLMAISIPYFVRAYNSLQFGGASRDFIASCQYARCEAVLQQQKAIVHVDLDGQRFWIDQVLTNDAGIADTPVVLRMVELPRQAVLVSAQAGDQSPQQHGIVDIVFYPNGTCDAGTVLFRGVEKADVLALDLDPVTARAIPEGSSS